jgi:hypothetical protein
MEDRIQNLLMNFHFYRPDIELRLGMGSIAMALSIVMNYQDFNLLSDKQREELKYENMMVPTTSATTVKNGR